MKFEINNVYNGFILLEIKNLKDIDSVGYLFQHQSSGARLLFLQNKDDNKVFSIGFRTIPHNDKGISHILEHSVLCGSQKYNVKDPFVLLNKGSLNTFLNAATYSDRTVYPVASKNDKDFLNLASVYLDAVFAPNVSYKEEIFMQEGCHLYLKEKEDELIRNGVVFNEMKGVFSSPESLLYRQVQKSLFPDNEYSLESGGDPEAIKNLKYPELVEFYKENYHPSNSYIYFYGDLDIIPYLKKLDGEYLSEHKLEVNTQKIKLQQSFKDYSIVDAQYSVSKDEPVENKTYLAMNWALGKSYSLEQTLSFNILTYLLTETESGPLKQALLKAELGSDVYSFFDQDVLQPYYSIVIKNTEKSKLDEFKDIVKSTLESLCKNGIDPKLVEASINALEFNIREADYGTTPKGLVYSEAVMRSWIYDHSPFALLSYEKTIKKISKLSKSRYFENLIEKFLVQNNHKSILILLPEQGLTEKKEQENIKELSEIKVKMSNDELEGIISKSRALDKFRKNVDSEEAIASLPTLLLNDIDKKHKEVKREFSKINDINSIIYPLDTNGIVYTTIYFDASIIPQDKLQVLELFVYLLTNVDTKSYNYSDLNIEIDAHTGGIDLDTSLVPHVESIEKYKTLVTISGKCLYRNVDEMTSLFSEICFSSKFNNKVRIKELIKKLRSRYEMDILYSGHIYSQTRLDSYISAIGVHAELTGGIAFYEFVRNLDEKFDEEFDKLVYELVWIQKWIFNSNNSLVTVCAEGKETEKIGEVLKNFISGLSSDGVKQCLYSFPMCKANEAFSTQGEVQYVSKGYDFRKLGYEYSGDLLVLKNLLSNEYLWSKVRVEGGAYGVWCGINRFGGVYFTSYRDPKLSQTLEVYDQTSSFLKKLKISQDNLKNNIIGTIGILDTPLTNSMIYSRENTRYFAGITDKYLQQEREQVLACTVKDLRGQYDMISDVIKQNKYCVVGSEAEIKKNKRLFGKIEPLHM